MKVKELIDYLKTQDEEKEVYILSLLESGRSFTVSFGKLEMREDDLKEIEVGEDFTEELEDYIDENNHIKSSDLIILKTEGLIIWED